MDCDARNKGPFPSFMWWLKYSVLREVEYVTGVNDMFWKLYVLWCIVVESEDVSVCGSLVGLLWGNCSTVGGWAVDGHCRWNSRL
jgi:hypothetical protein